MTSCPGTNQSVDTRTLKNYTWKADEYFIEILPWDSPKNLSPEKPLGQKTQASFAYLSPSSAPRTLLFASCNLFPKPIFLQLTLYTSVTF